MNLLTPSQTKLIENVKHWECANAKQAMRLLDIIELQQRVIEKACRQRNNYADDAYGEFEVVDYDPSKDNKTLQEIMEGEG